MHLISVDYPLLLWCPLGRGKTSVLVGVERVIKASSAVSVAFTTPTKKSADSPNKTNAFNE